MRLQEGASESDLSVLPKYKFQRLSNEGTPGEGGGSMIPVETNGYSVNARILSPDDAVCLTRLN